MTEESSLFCEFIYCGCNCGFTRSKYVIHYGRERKDKLAKYIRGHEHRGRPSLTKGGRSIDKDGYVSIWKPDHPYANNKGYVFEHRLVMEQHLGRYLTPEEVVHHKNIDNLPKWESKQDNRIENLQLYQSNGVHMSEEITKNMSDRFCVVCGSSKTVLGRKKTHHNLRPKWSLYNDGFLCNKCDCKKRRGTLVI